MRVVGLGGGIGASRVWRALAAALDPACLTLVVNTADDLWMHGLRVCPDLDTTVYALGGRQDVERGWGVLGETWRCAGALRELGHDVWFNLGDLDLATHLLRTGLLHEGAPLSQITGRLARAHGVDVRVLPMTDDEVTTRVVTSAGHRLHYEEFLVRHGAEADIAAVEHEGLAAARPAPGVLDAIAAADVIVLAPSNPVASLDPILGLAGVREALRARRSTTTAVSSIVSRVPIEDAGEARRARSRAALLAVTGERATATGIAARYADVAGRFVVDAADAAQAPAIRGLGLRVLVAPTLLHRGAPPDALLAALLAPSGPSSAAGSVAGSGAGSAAEPLGEPLRTAAAGAGGRRAG